jgi:hypothetical protein
MSRKLLLPTPGLLDYVDKEGYLRSAKGAFGSEGIIQGMRISQTRWLPG